MERGQDVHAGAGAPATEWLLTDGRGGFAAGAAPGIPERPDHVWLAVAEAPGRASALLLRFDEHVAAGDVTADLTGGWVAAEGVAVRSRAAQTALERLESFVADPWPTWRYRLGDVVIERALRPIEAHAGIVVSWRLVEGTDARLAMAPLLVAREPRALHAENAEFRGAAQGIPGRVRCETLPGKPALTFWHNGAFLPAKAWRALAYPLAVDDAAPNEPLAATLVESAFVPGVVHATLARGHGLHVVVSPEEGLFRALASEERLGTPPARTLAECVAALDAERLSARAARRRRYVAGADETARQAAAAHARVAEGAAEPTAPVIPRADEGPLLAAEDTWVAPLAERLLGALVPRPERIAAFAGPRAGGEHGADALRLVPALVALRQFGHALAIVSGALDFLDEGVAPERFDADDGTPRYGDPSTSLWLVHATELLVRRTGDAAFLKDRAWPAVDGLLHHLRSGSRHGVRCDHEGLLWSGEGDAASARADVNALWYHALVAGAQLGRQAGRRENAAFTLAWAHELQQVYLDRFWDERTGGLFVALTGAGPVRGAEPSQLLAASLSPALLAPERATRLIARVEREGLLAGDDGLEWLGPWAAATLRANGRGAASRARVREAFAALERAGGAARVAGARSGAIAAAELLRAWIEDADHAPAGVAPVAR